MEDEENKKLILTPLDESADEIGEVLANKTCRKILAAIADETLSSSQLSKKLLRSVATVEYNVNKLEKISHFNIPTLRY